MSFTEADLNTQLDSAGGGRSITIERFLPGPVNTDGYYVGVVAPYAGRARWITVSSTATGTVAAAAIVTGMTA